LIFPSAHFSFFLFIANAVTLASENKNCLLTSVSFCLFIAKKKMSKRRRDFSTGEKLKILKEYDCLPRTSLRAAAVKLEISHVTLGRILQDRSTLECLSMDNINDNRKRQRSGKDECVEMALKDWFLKVREKDARVDGPLLRAKAEELARKMNKIDFVATEGWFHRWKKRENISFKKTHGEQGEADQGAASSWLQTQWPAIVAQYSPSQIFNADETGLYFRALPEHTYALKNDQAKGSKTSKERLTLLCCASMDGEKKKLFVIGKSKKPRCFKGVQTLPVHYSANKNAWMTASIFDEWLKSWDKELDRNILLLIDNCPAHIVNASLKHIKVVFLPANTTSLMQPCDQGIIRTFKAYYRAKRREKVITVMDDYSARNVDMLSATEIAKKITVLDALHFANEAWHLVKDVTIQNCFRHGGFTHSGEEEELSLPEKPADLSDAEYNEWINIDTNLQTTATLTEEEICEAALTTFSTDEQVLDKEEEDDDSDTDDEQPPPTEQEMTDALAVLRRGVQRRADEEGFEKHYKYEQFITKILQESKTQSTLDKFMKTK
jgi:hypothetical protein